MGDSYGGICFGFVDFDHCRTDVDGAAEVIALTKSTTIQVREVIPGYGVIA